MRHAATGLGGARGLLVGGLLALMLPGCDEKKTIGPAQVYTGPVSESTNVLEIFSDSAKLKFRVSAPVRQQFENEIVYPKGMSVTFYGADSKTVVNTLNAHYGKLEQNKNLFTMRGDVQVANVPEQQKLFTEELFFDRGKQLIYTKPDMFVKVVTPTEYLTGRGLTANQNFSSYRITSPEGTFAVDQAAAP